MMKTLLALLFLSVALVLQSRVTNSFTFPTILRDAREALMKFSTKACKKPTSVGSSVSSCKPSNNFLEILSKVEKSILEAQASGNRRTNLNQLTKSINSSLTGRSYLFARQVLAQALYGVLSKKKRGKRSINPGKDYLAKLKKDIGEKRFNKLLGIVDYKTLVFAIDDTGSMGSEIEAAKSIATSIVKSQAGKEDVDYILSVFNDPTTGPVFRMEKGDEFIKELNKLRAHGGGDGPELAFTGMLNALEEGPQEGSPMFVFTDAEAKDHKAYKETVIESAKDFGVNINFFAKHYAASFPSYIEAAKETCGMILRLSGSHETLKLANVIKLSLNNYACISGGDANGGTRRKRSVHKNHHVIQIDDTVEKMIISISTENSNPVVTLLDPKGIEQIKGKISLYYTTIYELFNPKPAGRWNLTVASSAGRYHYLVRGASKTNINFDYYFVMVPKSGGKLIPISQPLSGQVANAIITVTGVEKIQRSSLKLDLIDKTNGGILKTVPLTQRTGSKAHFTVTFTPPSKPFQLQMRGKTLAGNPFERTSRRIVQPLTAILRVYKATNGQLAIPRSGRRMYVIMKIFNNGLTEKFDVSINDPLGYSTSRRKQTVKVNTKSNRRFLMFFSASKSAKPGKAYPVAVTITGKKTGVKAAQILNMIVI